MKHLPAFVIVASLFVPVVVEAAEVWGLKHERLVKQMGVPELSRTITFASCVYSYSRDNPQNLAFSLNLAVSVNDRLNDLGYTFDADGFDNLMFEKNQKLLADGAKKFDAKAYCQDIADSLDGKFVSKTK